MTIALLYFGANPLILQAQTGHNYREYKREACIDSERAYKRHPEDLYFASLAREGDLFVVYNDPQWFEEYFGKQGRKLGIQMLTMESFDCQNPLQSPAIYNTTPLNLRQMQARAQERNGLFYLHLGSIPAELAGKSFDTGIVISRNGRKCVDHWQRLINVHDWDILESALLADTLVFKGDRIPFRPDTLTLHLRKTVHFEVKFPKNQTTFDKKALHDFLQSLPLREYQALDVNIRAYASVEGPEERNQQLYWERSRVVYEAVNTFFALEELPFQCEVDENWEAFRIDIKNTPYARLAQMSKEEIREQLNKASVKQDLEPILEDHRRTYLSIHMQQSFIPAASSMDELMQFYDLSMETENLMAAIRIQNAIFERIQGEAISSVFPDHLPIPGAKAFNHAFNREYVLRYTMGLTDMQETAGLFAQLAQYYPTDPFIRFNEAELLFRRWMARDPLVEETKLLNIIRELPQYEVPLEASQRILLNYHMEKISRAYEARDLRRQSNHLSSIRNLLGSTILKPKEILSLSKFFYAYNQVDWAERMLRPYARIADIDEDLLFHYINITLSQEAMLNARWYQILLTQAQSRNPQRFCALFTPTSEPQGKGISVLLKTELKERYCKHCQ